MQPYSSLSPSPLARPRSLQLGLFAAGAIWLLGARILAAQASQGIGTRFNLSAAVQSLLSAAFLLFLLLVGFAVIDWIGGARGGGIRHANALPARATARREWQTGAVLGWSAVLFAVLPMGLSGRLHPQFWFGARAWGSAALSIVTLLVGMLAVEVAFRGYLLRRMIGAAGPTGAAIVLSICYAVILGARPNATTLSVLLTFIAGLLFSMAYIRTNGLWLGWGLHFTWAAATAVIFGLPIEGSPNFSSVVTTDVSGPAWLTGGAYGPEGALLTAIVLIGTGAVLYRKTKDYAWSYTQPTIVPGGYPVNVAPPAAHVAMEEATSNNSSGLVQILGTTPLSNGAGAPLAEESVTDVSAGTGSA